MPSWNISKVRPDRRATLLLLRGTVPEVYTPCWFYYSSIANDCFYSLVSIFTATASILICVDFYNNIAYIVDYYK